MRLDVSSNILSVANRLQGQKRSEGLTFTISAENRMEYAVAVDQGYTQKVTRKQEIAILISLKKRGKRPSVWEGQPGYSKTELDEAGYAYEITIPPAGILARSVKPIEAHIKSVLGRMPVSQEAAEQIARGMEAILVNNTPVDQGPLSQAWVVNIR